MTAPHNYSFQLTDYCHDREYFFTVKTYDDNGGCTKSVFWMKPGKTAQVASSTKDGMPLPEVVDGITAVAASGARYTTDQLQQCYVDRHQDCPCE